MIEIDGTPDKKNLGANAILGVSLVCARAAASVLKLPLASHLSSGYQPDRDISIALDPAANDFYHDGSYKFEGNNWTSEEMIEYYLLINSRYPIVSIEDGLAEDDWEGQSSRTVRERQMIRLLRIWQWQQMQDK